METVGIDSVRSGFSARPTLDLIQQSPGGYIMEGLLPLETFLSIHLLSVLSPTELSWLLRTLGLHLALGGASKTEMGLVRQDGNSSCCSPGAVPHPALPEHADKTYVLWSILLPLLFPLPFHYISMVLTGTTTPTPATTWLGRKHRTPHHQKRVGTYFEPRKPFSFFAAMVSRFPARSTSPLPSCTLWPHRVSFGIQSKIMSPVLLREGNFNMDVGGSRTGPSMLAGGPGDQTACSVHSQLHSPHCIQLSCPNGASMTQSPEDSPCDTLVQCLLSAVIMPNKAL